ncbi:efflux RND transporter periplasmic adaptor subunit [Alicyclobacillus contaminans]|uniref:efflux RND transporter periplasmic adaptor subunit n=1 Tax=Alicyclobacillus contaminans TaxID=392016 RepID=UPI00146FAD04|nr:efflux RND transporter periplasmic adaptor subunit [Alicyclobacillus contaminans]
MGTSVGQESEFIQPMFKKSRRKWIYSGIAVVVVLGAGIPALAHTLGGSTPIPANDIYQVRYGNVMQTVSASGTIQVPTEIDLNFSGSGSSGSVKSVGVKIGQKVKAGQVLAQLDDSTAQTQVATANAQVAQAKANLASAQAKLAQDEEGPTKSAIAIQQANVEKAQATLSAANQQYQLQLQQYNDRTSDEQALVNAQNALAKDEQTANDTSSVSSAQAQVDSAQAALAEAEQTLQQDQAQYGNITEEQVQQAYQAYQDAQARYYGWANGANTGSNPYSTQLQNAENQYNTLNSEYQDLQQAQQAVNNAKTTLAQAQADLKTAQTQVAQAQQQIQADELAVQQAEDEYNNRTTAKQNLENAQSQVQQAQADLDSAKASLQQAEQPADSATIKQDEASIAGAQAGLQSAEANLESAQLQVQNTMLKAPIDGVVTQVNIKPGELPSNSTPAIVIDDSVATDLQVNIQVSESQMGSIKPGQAVDYTVSTYPGETFHGTITEIYPTPQVVSNVTEYTVMATIDNSSGKLKPGMTTNVTIHTAEKDHVLTVPAIALQTRGSIEGVYVYDTSGTSSQSGNSVSVGSSVRTGGFGATSNGTGAGTGAKTGFGTGGGTRGGAANGISFGTNAKLPKGVRFQPVEVGLFGTNTVEITAGLSPGEEILLQLPGNSASTNTPSSSGGIRMGMGGFGGGGGRAFGGGGGRG